jgi:uncharacterized Zn-finger protein
VAEHDAPIACALLADIFDHARFYLSLDRTKGHR